MEENKKNPELEEFEVICAGKKVIATRRGPMQMFIRVPSAIGFRNTISRDKDGWLFLSTQDDDPYYQCNILLKDDGSLHYANEDSRGYKEIAINYVPGYEDAGYLEETAKQLYSVAKQFEAYEKLGVSPMKVMLLRGLVLKQTLKMLGYADPSDVETKRPDTSISILDLNRIADTLENYQNLGAYITATYDRDRTPYISINMPKDISPEEFREKFRKMYDDTFEMLGNNGTAIQEHSEKTDFVRSNFLTDYCTSMQAILQESPYEMYFGLTNKSGEKVLPRMTESEALEQYTKVVKRIAEIVLDLNFDLLPYSVSSKRINSVSLVDTELYHKIGVITDSDDFRLATITENKFVEIENYRYIDVLNSQLGKDENGNIDHSPEAERVRNSSIGKQLVEFIQEAQSDIDKRRYSTAQIEKWKLYFDKERKVEEQKPTFSEGPDDK